MESDERFKHLASDPRFKNLRKKQNKVQIDKRFQSMFTDEKFGLRENLKKYYRIEDESDDEKQKVALAEKKTDEDEHEEQAVEDEEQEKDDGDEEEEEEPEEELSSSSDESESEVEEESADEDDWQPLDHDAERAEIHTKRLAIMNLDWKNLQIEDIYVLLASVRPPLAVTIYVSEYGKEKLAKEEADGPDLPDVDEDEDELNKIEEQMNAIKQKANQYEDADEVKVTNIEAIRRYQLSQLKYYYAIAEFDSVESAEAVYKELDGVEYEGSSLELDLRFVPDDVEFDPADVKAKCDKAPDLAAYKAPQFIASALQQTTVKCTWDETDVKRQQKLRKAYTKEELEKDDLDAYLASETESDEEGADKYKELLMELNDNDEKKKKLDVDVQWDDNDDDDVGNDDSKSSDSGGAGDDGDDRIDDVDDDGDEEHDAGLDLLVMDSSERENFKFNPDDERFKAVYESGLYNIDPSHPSFKRSEAFNQIAERKREKRRRVK
jgi:hypothetical protein